jgi:peroxiredoxin Q/BCP
MHHKWIHGFVAVLGTVSAACQSSPEPSQAKPETVTQSAKPAPSATAAASTPGTQPAAGAATAPGSATVEGTVPAAGNEAAAAQPAAGAEGSALATELKAGDPAPALTLALQDGKTVDLASLKGKQVVLYFYPKDDTPGCTVEAQGIRDQWQAFEKAGIQVFGVSRQDAASHTAFIEKHKLPFNLVVDGDGSVTKAFGVPVSGGEYAARHTFLIGADGNIKQVWRTVNPAEHARELLEAAGVSPAPAATKAG